MKVIWNSELVDRNEVKIDPEDRGYQFGDGIYEVVRAYNGEFFYLNQHVDRLFSNASKIELVIAQTKNEIKELLHSILEENKIGTGNVYIQVTRGIASPRDHAYTASSMSSMITGTMTEVPRDQERMEDGINAITYEDIRWMRCDIKTISLLGNIMTKHEAHKMSAEEAILHRDGTVTECSASNVAIVKDNTIYTHPDGNFVLPGVTKSIWIESARESGFSVKEEAFTVEDLFEADEVFCSSTTIEILPIIEIDGNHVGNGKPGEITRKIGELYKSKIEEKCGTI